MLSLAFPRSKWSMKYPCFNTLGFPFSSPTFWKLNGSALSLVASFFGKSLTQAGICLASNWWSFRYHGNTSLFMCGSRGRCLVINSSYHTCISFILSPLPYRCTHFGLPKSTVCPSFTMSIWSYHWWSMYPFVSMPLWEWSYNSSWYNSKYY
jgi:hypothetical protein